MPSDVDEVMLLFEEQYRIDQHPAIRELRRRVLGSPLGGISYTTDTQVDDLGGVLSLGTGTRLLEVGAGIGWPGLALAERTGCDVVLTDVPVDGLQLAKRLAADRGVHPQAVIAASGGALPFRPATFDAISHSDVLC